MQSGFSSKLSLKIGQWAHWKSIFLSIVYTSTEIHFEYNRYSQYLPFTSGSGFAWKANRSYRTLGLRQLKFLNRLKNVCKVKIRIEMNHCAIIIHRGFNLMRIFTLPAWFIGKYGFMQLTGLPAGPGLPLSPGGLNLKKVKLKKQLFNPSIMPFQGICNEESITK